MNRKPNGQFAKGAHWRPHQQFREEEWLRFQYIALGRSSAEIASECGVGNTAIQFWLKRHGIPTRSISEARKLKHWGPAGAANPMFGKTGPSNPNWRGGYTPARQSFYASHAWKQVKSAIRHRDRRCLLCPSEGRFHYHHIIPFSVAPLLVLFIPNICRLCIPCHKKIRGNEMRYAKRLQRIVAGKGEPVR